MINIDELQTERAELEHQLLNSDGIELSRHFRERQVELFDLNWRKRDPDGYAALQAECDELFKRSVAAAAAAKARRERWHEICRLIDDEWAEVLVIANGDVADFLHRPWEARP